MFKASVSDLTGYMTLGGKLEFGNNVGQYREKNQNIPPVEQHCRLRKHVMCSRRYTV